MRKNNKDNWINPHTESLFEAILKLNNAKEAQCFFRDLLTEREIIEFAKRWRVAKLLENKVSYTKIEEEVGMSSTTIARIHKWLKHGMGGYKLLIDREKKNKEKK